MCRPATALAAVGLLSALLSARVVAAPAEPPKPTAGPSAAGGGSMAKADEEAVRRTVLGFEAAWNAHDMEALGRLFTPDADWINVVGMHWQGRDAIVKAHAAFHATMFKNHSLKTDAIVIRPLGPDHALAVVTTTNDAFTTPSGQVMPKAQNIQTYVLTKAPDGWKVVHGHNVVVNADAVRHDPAGAPAK